MRRILALAVLFGMWSGVLGAPGPYGRSSGYYFRPSRTIFFYRPDYLFPAYGFGNFGWRRFDGCNIYSRGYAWGPYRPYSFGPYHGGAYAPQVWVGGLSGAYSFYLQSPIDSQLVQSNTADLVFNVTPSYAQVYVDNKLIGSARDYASGDHYTVIDGVHSLRVEYPGYKPFQAQMNVQANRTVHVDVELVRD
jgi:hypothetical protein